MMLVLLLLTLSGSTLSFQSNDSNTKVIPVENNVYPKFPFPICNYYAVERGLALS